MARFLVLYIEDNEEAERIVGQLRMDGGLTSLASPADSLPEVHDCRIFGLFGCPTTFCTCDHNDRTNPLRVTRGSRLGWYVHRGCGRVVRGSWQSPRNLLDPDWSPSDPEFMFHPKLTWIHKQVMPQHVRDAAVVAPPSDDAQSTSE